MRRGKWKKPCTQRESNPGPSNLWSSGLPPEPPVMFMSLQIIIDYFFQMTRQRVADFRVLRRTAPSSSVKNRSGPARWLGTPATGGSNFWGQPGGSAATMGPGCHKEFHSVVSHLWTSNYFIWAPNSCTIASVTEACLVGSLPASLLAFGISAR